MPVGTTDHVALEGGATDTGHAISRFSSLTGASFGVGILATLVSFVGSWRVSLWSDEVATISAADRGTLDLLRLLQNIDAVHGVYYAAMHGWISLFGASPVSVRVPSALAVGAGATGLVVLGARLVDVRFGVVAGIACALLPRVTWAGIEGRSWALTLALAVWATLALHVASTRGERRWWVAYGVLMALGIGVNIYVALLLVAHGTTVALVARRLLWRWLAVGVASVVAAGGVVVRSITQGGQLGTTDLGPFRLARNILVNQWFLGETPTPTTGTGTAFAGWPDAWKVAAVVLAGTAWVAMAVAVVGRRSRRPTALAWSLPWLVLPTALVALVALVEPSLYNPRYFVFCAPAVALVLAVGLRALGKWPFVAVVTVLAVAAVPVYASQRTVLAKSSSDLLLVADHLSAHARPGDAIYYGPRDDAVGGVVTRSLRTVSIGYPGSVKGLYDVTLLESPADGTTLFGTSITLEAAEYRLDGYSTLWVVRRQDRTAEAGADDELLKAAGFRPVNYWLGPQTTVLEMQR